MSKTMYLNYTSSLENITELNSSFDVGTLKIAYHGLNRNNSFISKESFIRNIKSMFNCPVVTNYKRDEIDANGNKGDFGSHDAHIEIEKDDNGKTISIEYINDTYPIGVVYESAPYWWEEIEDDSGLHEYLCTNVILWKRQDAYNKLKEEKSFNHSMEINVTDGSFSSEGYYEIRDFEFTAFCILSNSVTPCFESSKIELFNNDIMKEEFSKMMKELKEISSEQFTQNQLSSNDIENKNNVKEGGNSLVDEKLEILKQFNLTPEQLSFNIDEVSIEELESKVKEQFALTAEQFREELMNELRAEQIEDDWGWKYSRYSYVDYKDNVVYAFDRSDNYRLVGFEFSTQGDKVSINFESKKRKKFEIVDFEEGQDIAMFEVFPKEAIEYATNVKEKELEAKFTSEKENATNEIQSKLDEVSAKYSTLESEIEGLKEFQTIKLAEERKVAEESLFAQYEQLNGIKAYEELKQNCANYSIADLEKEIALVFVKNTANFSLNEKKENGTIKIAIEHKEPTIDTPYGDLFDRFLNK